MKQIEVPFTEAVKRALSVNYCNFNGRSSRSEYWWFCLFSFILGIIIGLIFRNHEAGSIVSGIISLAFLLPGLGISIRRLHDTGRSGWWILLALIPVIGSVILIVWYCQPSQPTANQYGEIPNLV
ncbi:MAG: DUF805 domain-containing protein [Muribaculum sp.]|nr:DUF805 domain-containing protein [Muribaculum sp.]